MNDEAKSRVPFRKILSDLLMNFPTRYRSELEAEKNIGLFFDFLKETSGEQWQENKEDNISLYFSGSSVCELDEVFVGMLHAIKRASEWFLVEELDNECLRIVLKLRQEWGEPDYRVSVTTYSA